eukprot:TRINITY_DN24391_c0_g1_i1.p1 TRINITY_DN24391_c0_g1~~TRINITY_DN24391_c0_g1_i1.p1  ORF type:complete len:282 (-),score=47.87 TRINITY_DN24391_c0_g1_i1:85-930(-)
MPSSPSRGRSRSPATRGTVRSETAQSSSSAPTGAGLEGDVFAEAARRAALARAKAIKTLHSSRDRACVFFLQGNCKLYSKCTNFHPQDPGERARWLRDYFAMKCMLAERCNTPACLYSHPGQVWGQPPPGGTVEEAELQDQQAKAEKAAREKLRAAQEEVWRKPYEKERDQSLAEAAIKAAAKLGLHQSQQLPPPPPPVQPPPPPATATSVSNCHQSQKLPPPMQPPPPPPALPHIPAHVQAPTSSSTSPSSSTFPRFATSTTPSAPPPPPALTQSSSTTN